MVSRIRRSSGLVEVLTSGLHDTNDMEPWGGTMWWSADSLPAGFLGWPDLFYISAFFFSLEKSILRKQEKNVTLKMASQSH